MKDSELLELLLSYLDKEHLQTGLCKLATSLSRDGLINNYEEDRLWWIIYLADPRKEPYKKEYELMGYYFPEREVESRKEFLVKLIKEYKEVEVSDGL